MGIDDSMDVFAEHGVAGIVGLLFNALFGSDAIVGLDGVNVGAKNPTTGTAVGGWIIHNYRQLYIQLAYIVATAAYTFVVSALIAYAINIIPGLKLRASEQAELLGMDDDQLGEFAYDYVEVRRDYLAWTPQKNDQVQDANVSRANLYGCGEHSGMFSNPGQETKSQPISSPTPSKFSSQTNLRDVTAVPSVVGAPDHPSAEHGETVETVDVELSEKPR